MMKITYNISPVLSGKSSIAEFSPVGIGRCNTPQKCRIQLVQSSTTCAYYSPVYDGFGNNLNPDRNQTTNQMHCSTCGKDWTK